jgi:periplasmic protein TonB
MRDLPLRSLSSRDKSLDSWAKRVRENCRALLASNGISPSSANGAPIHLLKLDPMTKQGRAQGVSLLVHAAILTALAVLAMHPLRDGREAFPPGTTVFKPFTTPADLFRNLLSERPKDGKGVGGNKNPLPTRNGELAHISSIQIVRPTLPQNARAQLPVPPTILDPNAPAVLTPINKLGLPWMPDNTNSPGPGKGGTLGAGQGTTMGDTENGRGGRGHSDNGYRRGVTYPVCLYCPYPLYTDEAREAKVQGTVLLRVLVGADGRAAQVQVVKGLGLGLEDRAIQSVRGWRFAPARDAAGRAVQEWVMIESVFRLF